MAGFYANHNGGIALKCFAGGILAGIVTVLLLIYNGIRSWAPVSGYLIGKGHSERFLSFVVSHGSFELVAIAWREGRADAGKCTDSSGPEDAAESIARPRNWRRFRSLGRPP